MASSACVLERLFSLIRVEKALSSTFAGGGNQCISNILVIVSLFLSCESVIDHSCNSVGEVKKYFLNKGASGV
jgi:hypothetical protein